MAVTVRYWAAAREAAGVEQEDVSASSIQELRHVLTDLHGAGLAKILSFSSLLVDGLVATSDSVPLGDATQVDVLPPFAGG